MDYLKTIRLGYGKGEPGKQACWMTALSSHIGGEWIDRCVCVDPVINRLCILINDSYIDNEDRTRDVMEFGLFKPLYTKGTKEDMASRFFKYVDTIYRKWYPLVMKQNDSKEYDRPKVKAYIFFLASTYGNFSPSIYLTRFSNEEIAKVENLPPVVDIATFNTAERLIREIPFFKGFLPIYCRLCSLEVDLMRFMPGLSALNRLPNRKELIFDLLDELITMGPHAPDEPSLPVCGIPKFLELVGHG